MNILSSRTVKSTKQLVVNRSTQAQTAYTCQLYIESFKISYRGYVYFLWSTDNIQTQSLRVQSVGKLVDVKETLTISVRVSSRNGKQHPLNTFLKLMTQNEQQLDEFQITVNNLSSQYQEMEIPMDRGIVYLKARRKQRKVGQQEELSHLGLYRSKIRRHEDKSIVMNTGEYQSMQQELNKIRKELEDEIYLNNKLKNDREVLLATKQELEIEIQTMLIQVSKEVSVLRQHFENRITIRDHCYQEEIEDIVSMFNSNAENSKRIIETIMKQKIKLQEQFKPLVDKNKKLGAQLVLKQKYLDKLNGQKHQLEMLLQRTGQSLTERNKEIQHLQKDNSSLKDNILSLNINIESLHKQVGNWQETGQGRELEIQRLKGRIHEFQLQIGKKDALFCQLSADLAHQKQKTNGLIRQKELTEKEVTHLNQEKQGFFGQIQGLKSRLQTSEYQMEFNENVIGQLKIQLSQKQQQLCNLEQMCSKKLQDIINNFETDKHQLVQSNNYLALEREELLRRISQLENNVEGSSIKVSQLGGQINKLANQIKNNKDNVGAKDQLIAMLESQIEKLKKQIRKLKSAHSQEIQNLQKQHKAYNQQNVQSKRQQSQSNQSSKNKEKEKEREKSIQRSTKQLDSQSQKSIDDLFKNGMNEKEVKLIVIKKQRQIKELRKRVGDLEHLYDNLRFKLEEIAIKYPHVAINIESLEGNLLQPVEWCESEQEQEKIINSLSYDQEVESHKDIFPSKNRIPSIIKKTSIAEAVEDIQFREMPNEIKNRPIEHVSQKHFGTQKKSTGITRKQSVGGLVPMRVEIPKSPSLKKINRQNSKEMSFQQSQRSGRSFVKVSHAKKIMELEKAVDEHAERQKQYINAITNYEKNIDALKKQAESVRKQLEQKSYRPKLVNKESQVVLQDERLRAIMDESQIRQLEIQKLYLKISDLEQLLKAEKLSAANQIANFQLKMSQNKLKQQETVKRQNGLNQNYKNLQRQIAELDDKWKRQKENAQQTRLVIKQLGMKHQNAENQLKKTKITITQLEGRIQQLIGSEAVIRELSKEIQDLSKKGLEQIRIINHLKLEKDSIEEELKLCKKRQNQQLRIATEWQEKAASLERAIEEMKRKENKLKRELQQGHDDLRRNKLQTKKVEEELQIISTAQGSWQVEKRKHLDQISNLQDQLSRKDYELNKLNKQIEKWKARSDEKDELRMGKKSEMREEIDRLEAELTRKQKKILQQTQQNKLLRARLELLERQNKRIIQQKSQSYGEKLKYYVDQMSNIKKLLQQYQNENNRLKIDNNELYEKSEIMRLNYDNIKLKYDQNIERQENILNDLQGYINETNLLKDRLAQSHRQIDQVQSYFVNLKKQSDQQKLQFRRQSQKLDNSDRNLERALNEIRDLKIKLSQSEVNKQITSKAGERYKMLERANGELQQSFKKLKSQYNNIVSVYIFKREDLQKAVLEARNNQKQLRELEIQQINEDFSKSISMKTQRLQQQILDLYNENNRLKSEIMNLSEQQSRYKNKLLEYQGIIQKLSPLQNQHIQDKSQNQSLRQQVNRRTERLTKLEAQIQSLRIQLNFKENDQQALKYRIKELQQNLSKLNIQLQQKSKIQRQLQNELIKAEQIKSKMTFEDGILVKQRQAQIIQQYQLKINQYQLQLQRAKDKQTSLQQESNNKMKKLQQKLDQMEEALKQRERTIESHYESEIQQLQNSLLRLSQQLEQKIARMQELNEAIIILEGQNKNFDKQNQSIRYQYQQQRQTFETELKKLKNKLMQSQAAYTNNLKALEDEIFKAAQLKQNTSGSRVKAADNEERIAKRYEEKVKNKDRKIQQLNQSISSLQETIVKYKKKEKHYQLMVSETERFKAIIADYERQKKTLQLKIQDELKRNGDIIKDLKKEITRLKDCEQKYKLNAQEKKMEHQSMLCELKTTKQLYQELQRQLDRRKNKLTTHLEEESAFQVQLRQQQLKITQLQKRQIESLKKLGEVEAECKKKNSQVKKYLQIIQQLQKNEERYQLQITKLTAEIASLIKSAQQSNNSCESLKVQIRQAKAELLRMRKLQEQLREDCLDKQELAINLKRINDQLSFGLRQSEETARRYVSINQNCKEQLGCQIEDLVERFLVNLSQKEAEINQLIEETQELKFLNERKFIDYDALKKENIELQIKIEDIQVLNDQLDALRKICDKLEQQKKGSVFREQVLRMQMQNLANIGAPQLRYRIETMLSSTYSHFGFN